MKLLVETTGAFQLYMPGPEQFARSDRPSVVRQSTFFDFHTGKGALTILGQVNDDATDEDFAAFKGTPEAFIAKYPVEKPEKPAKAPKPAAEAS